MVRSSWPVVPEAIELGIIEKFKTTSGKESPSYSLYPTFRTSRVEFPRISSDALTQAS
jgi:hypothetical protein